MAHTIKALRAHFADSLRASNDPDQALADMRAALVRFERGEQNRDRTLADFNMALDGHGIEALRGEHESSDDRPIADYVNMGDAYAATILFCYRRARFVLSTWADFYERSPEGKAYRASERRAELARMSPAERKRLREARAANRKSAAIRASQSELISAERKRLDDLTWAQNENGLTFPRWLDAAGKPGLVASVPLRAAWQAGGDPSDHRAER